MILLVTGGREYSMKPHDWMRLDALHFPSTLPPEALAHRHKLMVEHGGPSEDMMADARAYPGPVTALYEGEADGADTCARAWAESRGIPVRGDPVTKAEWKEHGKAAGHIRNRRQLDAAIKEARATDDFLQVVGFPGGPGTANQLEQAERARRDDHGLVRILDCRGGPAQRWTVEDVKACEKHYESLRCGGDPEDYSWEMAIMERWLERGAGGMPVCSAHLWTQAGKASLPTAACTYIGRYDHRQGFQASPLANPFKSTGDADEGLLERYRSHLRSAYKINRPVQQALRGLKPWSLLVCWCHATRPCHGVVVADAVQQVQASIAIKAAGRELPAPHWSAYKLARTA